MIDLHAHTDQSDGSLTPAELVAAAVRLPLTALAITDHDTLAGYDLAVPAAVSAGIELICGIELSTRLQNDPSAPRSPSVHLLGYFPDRLPSPAFRRWLHEQQASRHRRNLALVAQLQSLGVDIVLEEAQKLGKNLTGRPHFAKVLLQKGYVRTTQEAFDVYLADTAKAAVAREEPTLIEGIQRICEAGGLACLAHPFRLSMGRDEAALKELLRDLVSEGLGGIEAYHSEHTPADVELYLRLAEEFGLIVTGGSDFHGDNKPGIELGTGKNGNLALPDTLLERLSAPPRLSARN